MNSDYFLRIIRDEVRKELEKTKPQIKFGKVVADYVSGRPNIIFDGEEVPSGKGYAYLSSYSPAANDRVQLINGVIQGKII